MLARRIILGVGVAVGLLCLVAPVTQAGAPAPSQVWAHGPGLHWEPGGVSIIGSASANDVTVTLQPEESGYLVHDRAGLIPPEPFGDRRPCAALDNTTVRCEHLGSGVGASLGAGKDKFAASVEGSVAAFGGPGADRINGSTGGDALVGEPGGDRLAGRSGDDDLVGDAGRDSAYGNRGDDLLDLAKNDRDRVIDCGPGDDVVVIDRNRDPQPRGCEHVRSG